MISCEKFELVMLSFLSITDRWLALISRAAPVGYQLAVALLNPKKIPVLALLQTKSSSQILQMAGSVRIELIFCFCSNWQFSTFLCTVHL